MQKTRAFLNEYVTAQKQIGSYAEKTEFQKRLCWLREKKRISRIVLSELCGLSSDAVRRYERGEAVPSISSLEALADFFGVSIDYMIGRELNNEVEAVKQILQDK